jgi:hypothetical protein
LPSLTLRRSYTGRCSSAIRSAKGAGRRPVRSSPTAGPRRKGDAYRTHNPRLAAAKTARNFHRSRNVRATSRLKPCLEAGSLTDSFIGPGDQGAVAGASGCSAAAGGRRSVTGRVDASTTSADGAGMISRTRRLPLPDTARVEYVWLPPALPMNVRVRHLRGTFLLRFLVRRAGGRSG